MQIQKPVDAEIKIQTADVQTYKCITIKRPTVLEFLNLPNNTSFTETELEKAIITHLQQFLLELGKGYAFVGRQQLMVLKTKPISLT